MKDKIKYSVNSFSYYKSLCQGNFNIFDYIDESAALKCSELNPWFGHLTEIDFTSDKISESEYVYLSKVVDYARKNNIQFHLITVDGDTYIYDSDASKRHQNLLNAKKWIDITKLLNGNGVRFDASLPEDTTPLNDEILEIISNGYTELIKYAEKKGIRIFIENHYGITSQPDDLLKILNHTPDLNYLFDSWNWHHKKVAEGWLKCLCKASEVHIKTFYIKENGEDILVNIPSLLALLDDNHFTGCLTIETMPLNLENERILIQNSLNLIKSYRRTKK